MLCLWTSELYTQCAVDGLVNILPANAIQTRSIELEVSGLANDDLSGTQELCNIFMEFEHGRIENVKITLTSPAGQTITLTGPSVTGGGLSPLVRWNIIMGQCANPAAPDTGFDPVWDNAQPWAAFTEYTGIYHPQQGCLEDFDTGSANGTWTIDIENLGNTSGFLTFFALQFCDGDPGACTSCSPYAGSLGNQPIAFCEGTSFNGDLQFELQPEIGAQDSLFYFYQDPSGLSFFSGQLADGSSLGVGETTVCVLVADTSNLTEITDLSTVSDLQALADQPGICMDFGDCVTVTVLPFVDNRIINRTVCIGDTIMFMGEVYDAEIDTVFLEGSVAEPCQLRQQLILEVVEVTAAISGPASPLVCGELGFLDATSSSASSGPIIDYIWTTDTGNFISNLGPIAQVDAAGTYFLEVITESSGVRCSALDTLTVTAIDDFTALGEQVPFVCPEDNNLMITVRDTSALNPATLMVLNVQGPTGSTFDIDGENVAVDMTGTYTVTVGAGACSTDLVVTVVDNDLIAMPLTISTSNTITCAVDTASLITSATEPDLTYEWASPFGFSSTEATPTISESSFYFVTVTDINGCTRTSSMFVESEADFPENSRDQQVFDCAPPEQRRLSLSIDQPVDSVRWTGPDGFMSTEMNPLYVSEGTYEITMYGTNGCVSTEMVFVREDFSSGLATILDVLRPSHMPDCTQGESTVCWSNIWATLDSSLQFSWTNSSGQEISVDSCVTVTIGDVYTLNMTNSDGCTGERSIEIAPIVANIIATPSQLGCGVDTLTLDSSARLFGSDQVMRWTRDGIPLTEFDRDPIIRITEPGTYVYEIVDNLLGCAFSDTLVIEEITSDLSGLDVLTSDGDCNMPALLMVPTISALDSLVINGATVPLQESYTLPADTYTLQGFDVQGCTVDTVIILENAETVSVDLGPDQTVSVGSNVELPTLITGDVSSYLWTATNQLDCLDCPDNGLVAAVSDEIIVTVSSEGDCTDTDTLRLTVLDAESQDQGAPFYLPTHFQPGLIGEERLILGVDTSRVEHYTIRIYDRWGNLIVDRSEAVTTSTIDIWDGTHNGKPLLSGVYVFMAEFLYSQSISAVASGTITLLK